MALTTPILYNIPAFDAIKEQVFTFAVVGGSQAVTASGAVNYTAPVLSGALPTFGASAAVMTGATVDVSQPTFTGDKNTVNAAFTGTEVQVVSGVTYDKATVNAAETTFSANPVELAVGNITVASKEVTVQ